LLVAQALQAGETVRVLARNPAKLGMTDERLTVVTGELSDVDAIEKVVAGADGVSACWVRGCLSKAGQLPTGPKTSWRPCGSSASGGSLPSQRRAAADPKDVPTLRSRLAIAFARVFLREAYEDVIATAEAIRETDRDWTIVRPSLLNDGPKTGRVVAGYLGNGLVGDRLARANAADFMLRQLQGTSLVRQAPIASNA
jgi:hypothetical protein